MKKLKSRMVDRVRSFIMRGLHLMLNVPEPYVEISNRRTGKTTRLIDAVRLELIDPHATVLIVTPAFERTVKIYEKIRDDSSFTPSMFSRLKVGWTMIPSDYYTRIFIDEFDNIDPSEFKVINNGYYCGSEVFGVNITTLLKRTRGYYHTWNSSKEELEYRHYP